MIFAIKNNPGLFVRELPWIFPAENATLTFFINKEGNKHFV